MRITNDKGLPEVFREAIEAQTYPVTNSRDKISITRLIAPPRMYQLSLRYWDQMTEDAADGVWRLLGSSIHAILEKTQKGGREIELSLACDVDGVRVSGRLDVVENRAVLDYKVCSVWSLILGDKPEWEQQLNAYAWLCRKNDIPISELRIVAIIRDWQRSKAKTDPDYPPLPVQVVPLPLWEARKADDFIAERLRLHLAAFDMAEDEIPLCSPADRWQRPTTWAIYKDAAKKATRVLDDEAAAEAYAARMREAGVAKTTIVKRPGEDRRCLDFCSVAAYCYHGQKLIADRQLKDADALQMELKRGENG